MQAEKIPIGQPHQQADTSKYIRMRLNRLGITLLVMGASFVLYYLGFFGGIDGPLSAGRIGDLLAESGITQTHVLVSLLVMTALAGLWNIVLNTICRSFGIRLICRQPAGDGSLCSAPVRKIKETKADGRKSRFYLCEHEHITSEAGFQPIRKGMASYTIWFTLVLFCAIFYLLI